ncbi:MAG: hypothetical protein ABIC91_06615 [Nanoarchaeota archaeon]|nr:hypothetical protein [Nanoarchaeota archaeon]MBU1029667.1 hypothetical protein [Nanoarchaeota archaeon]MBU1849877.1 hypothetical protein [Nanoarchaeota archaeon]
MEIKIDTKKDSVEEIQKMVNFLSVFISEQKTDSMNTTPSSPGMFNMFGAEENKPKEDKDDENPKISIIEY